MQRIAFALLPVLILLRSEAATPRDPNGRKHHEMKLRVEAKMHGIGIDTYTLITDNSEKDRRDAEAIMLVKVAWPRAMQTKDRALFEQILAQGFTFRASDGLLEREAYIRDRVARPEAIGPVRYENLVLQLFGRVAVLTYRNIVNVSAATGKAEKWHMSWADVFVQERGKWRIGASHLISEQVESGVRVQGAS
jgi:hypothetical protein